MIKRLSLENFITREEKENNEMIIEGYFSVFDSPYIIDKCGDFETVDRHAFDGALDDDIRALINHDSSAVLGRTKVNTLELSVDDHGLFGRIHINTKDTDAVNLYERVKRGDVSQCSFGFDILDQDTELLENNIVHWLIKKVKLYEVSVVTFPAYEATGVIARSDEADSIRELTEWKAEALKNLKGVEKDD